MASLIGSAIIVVVALLALLWLPLRIRAVWNGEKSAPPIPIRKRSYHIVDFDVTDRNFPVFGLALFFLGLFGFLFGLGGVFESQGVSTPLTGAGAAMMVPTILIALVAQAVHSTGRPQFLVPPHLRGENRTDLSDVSFDFTNSDVQELLRTDEELLENLNGMVEDDMGRVLYEGERETHYAVLDIWWMQIARGLGHETPEDDDGEAYFETLYTTEAYLDHHERVGEIPQLDSDFGETGAFIVEHRSN